MKAAMMMLRQKKTKQTDYRERINKSSNRDWMMTNLTVGEDE